MVTICTASLTFNNSTFCPHSVFMCFVWISEQTVIISLYNINWLVFITEMVRLLHGMCWIFIYNWGWSWSLTINRRTQCCRKKCTSFASKTGNRVPLIAFKMNSALASAENWHLKRHTPKVIRLMWTLIQGNRIKGGRFLDPVCLLFHGLSLKKNFVNVRNPELPLFELHKLLKFFTMSTGHKGTHLRDSWCSTSWERQD